MIDTITTHQCILSHTLINLYFFQIVKERNSQWFYKKPNLTHRRTLSCTIDLGLDFQNSWWRLTGSNRRPPACKAGALPAELNPQKSFKQKCTPPFVWISLLKTAGRASRFLEQHQHDNSFDGGSGWARTNDPRVINTVL